MPLNLTSQQNMKIFHFEDYANIVNKTEIIMETHRRVFLCYWEDCDVDM